MGSKDSIPGRRMFCCWGPLLATAGRGSGGGSSWDDVMTWLSRLPGLVKLLLSGCQVLLRHASSATLLIESRRDQPEVEVVGEPSILALGEPSAAEFEAF